MSCLLGGIFKQLRTGDFHEQRVCVKYCFKLGKVFSETFEMLKQAFGDAAISRTKTRERYIQGVIKKFRDLVSENYSLLLMAKNI